MTDLFTSAVEDRPTVTDAPLPVDPTPAAWLRWLADLVDHNEARVPDTETRCVVLAEWSRLVVDLRQRATEETPMIPESPTTNRHWLTVYDDPDGEPYGELCTCAIGEDHSTSRPFPDSITPTTPGGTQ